MMRSTAELMNEDNGIAGIGRFARYLAAGESLNLFLFDGSRHLVA